MPLFQSTFSHKPLPFQYFDFRFFFHFHYHHFYAHHQYFLCIRYPSLKNITKLYLNSFVVAAHAIVALCSFFEIGASVWEISRVRFWLRFSFFASNIFFSRVFLRRINACICKMPSVCQFVVVGGIGEDVACQTIERDSHVYDQ
ncbi:hypothetical protein Ccrd_014894 [Cynara cardunculus var. scolymus]|uniref:Uncharacterized protein n=1 Tax=Cynara cardunculus var. scolymus TaxID=59895 RepID=A0A118K3Z7_CYNCS|nr:hypothetical protein Ccrd_014894 [Cynara cardunculus var. scolymus]